MKSVDVRSLRCAPNHSVNTLLVSLFYFRPLTNGRAGSERRTGRRREPRRAAGRSPRRPRPTTPKPHPPPQNPRPDAKQSAPQLQPERAQLLQNLLNAIPIASSDQITRMLQVFAPHNAQPSPSGHNNRAPAPHPYGPTYSLPPASRAMQPQPRPTRLDTCYLKRPG